VARRTLDDGARRIVSFHSWFHGLRSLFTASIVPYKAFKTSDGDILLGGGNDRLYGVLCNRIGKPELIMDERFKTNAVRVQNRDTLEAIIEQETKQKTTQEWLGILEGCGMRMSRLAPFK
jgi:crotonobetainyl-CoA:carnitine CoA-transferase CaiB-like acyl-CoA transferase